MSERTPLLSARAASYCIGGARLLDGVSVAVAPGEVVAVLGPNGAGKSTLLKLMSGELRPSRGRVVLGGRDIAAMTAGELARRRSVVAQASALAFPFTVREVVSLGISVPALSRDTPRIVRTVSEALDRVGLAAISGRPFTELSGGERQRTHIARALCQLWIAREIADEGQVLLLDEPTSSLDIGHQLIVLEAVRREAEAGVAVVAVMHDLNFAAAFADRVAILSGGRVIAEGAPREAMTGAVLSSAYECELAIDTVPADGGPFVLPPAGGRWRAASSG